MSHPLIRFSEVTKLFQQHTAVDSLDFEMKTDRIVGLLGPNGAGKTTCLKLAMGLTRPTAGSISVLGRDVLTDGPQVRQQVGYVPEEPVLYPSMTVAEVMWLASQMYESWDRSLADELLSELRLPPDRQIKALSKGMRVKAAILIALAHRPRIIVLDEPMSGLDPIARDDMIECLIRARGDRTLGILISSHHIDDVTRLADEIAVMHCGRIVVHSSVDDLIASTKRVETVLLDGRLPEVMPPQIIWQHVERRNWSMTLHPFDESLLVAIQEANPVSAVRVSDLGVEQIFKDFIRGATTTCSER